MQTISSRQNPKIKLARSLHSRKNRKNTGQYLVEGIRHVGELLASDHPVEFVCYSPEQLSSEFGKQLIEHAETSGTPVFAVDSPVFAALEDGSGPQGIVAVARQKYTPLDELDAQTCPWGVALVTPQDPGNIGTILRTMDAVEAQALFLLDGGSDPWHPTAVRASMGALFWHPIVQTDFESLAQWAQEHGAAIYGTSARGTAGYRETTYQQPSILLMGSEREGLSPQQAAACTQLVRLPIGGRGTSINLSIAAGVMLYAMHEKFLAAKPARPAF